MFFRHVLGTSFASGLLGRSGSTVNYRPSTQCYSSILPPGVAFGFIDSKNCLNSMLSNAERRWLSLRDVTPPGPALCAIQRAWDDSICGMRVKAPLKCAVEYVALGFWLVEPYLPVRGGTLCQRLLLVFICRTLKFV